MRHILSLLIVSVLLLTSTVVARGSRADDVRRLEHSTDVFSEIMRTPDKSIPHDLLDRAAAVVIIPGMTKGGIGIGGKYGKGIIMARNGADWSAPAFMTIEGGSFGLQLGLEKVDLVMLVMNREGVGKLLGDKVTLGGDASVAAGPVGRQTSAETDVKMSAEILAYSRAKGLFAGISLNGAVLKADNSADRDFYGKEMSAREIVLDGGVRIPEEARPLARALSSQSARREQ